MGPNVYIVHIVYTSDHTASKPAAFAPCSMGHCYQNPQLQTQISPALAFSRKNSIKGLTYYLKVHIWQEFLDFANFLVTSTQLFGVIFLNCEFVRIIWISWLHLGQKVQNVPIIVPMTWNPMGSVKWENEWIKNEKPFFKIPQQVHFLDESRHFFG